MLFSMRVLYLLLLYLSTCHQLVEATSFMIVGDSISQGRNRDYTWRYRLWQWIQSTGQAVTFVGPYTGTQGQAPPSPPTPPQLYGAAAPSNDTVNQDGGYALDVDSAFLGNDAHFAVWGRQLAQDVGQIAAMVSQYQPDYLLVELGFNDMGWFITDTQGTLNNMVTFINNARSAKPDIKLVIANVPQRSFIGGRDDLITKTDDYNAALPGLLNSLYTAESPAYVAQFRENYDCNPAACAAGSDGLHPDALGEFQIAKAFADTLSQGFSWPGAAFTIPSSIPVRACPAPSNVVAQPSACGITVNWDPVDGAYGYMVWNGWTGEAMSVWNTSEPTYMTTWTVANFTWNYQIQAICSNIVSDRSVEVSATADPTCAPAPSNIRANTIADGVSFTWDAVTGYDIDLYGVVYWDQSRGGYLSDVGFTGTSASVGGMNAGDRVITAVETWANNDGVVCAGLPGGGQGVVVGGVEPSVPSGLQVFTLDGGATAQLTWNSDPNAYAYGIYTHYLLEADQPYKLWFEQPQVACISMGIQFPGTWHYEYCVVAFNGNFTTEMSQCVTGPETETTVAACPTPASTAVGDPNPTVTWSNPSPTVITPSGSSGGTGGSTSIVYIDPTIWSSADPTAACEPPCTLVLPPWTLSSPTTLSFPVVTETIEETWPETTGGSVIYVTSTTVVLITIPPITTLYIDVSNVLISSSTSEIIVVTSSIVPPPITTTESSHGIIWTYKPGPYPPQGTSIGPPPGGNPTSFHFSVGPPKPTCLGLGCGFPCIINCGGGGPPGPGGSGCIGPGCSGGNNECVGEGCESSSETKTESSSCSVKTVTDYWVTCGGSACSTTSTAVVSGCSVTASATTTGSYCPVPTYDDTLEDVADPLPSGAIITTATSVIDGTTVLVLGYVDFTSLFSISGVISSSPPTSAPPPPPPPPTSTPPPTPTYSTGIAVAAYTVCSLEVCEYQWEIFTVIPAATSIPGCSTADALYSSVVTDLPDPSNVPRLGPFKVDGLSGCYYEHVTGGGSVSCVTTEMVAVDCFAGGSKEGNCVDEEVTCGVPEKGFSLDDYVYW